MTNADKVGRAMTHRGWATLGQLRKYPDLPTRLHLQHGAALVRRGLAREVGNGLFVMTELGQEVWTRHGPVDDRRYL